MTEHFLTTDIDYNMLYDTEFNVDGVFKLNGSPVVSQVELPYINIVDRGAEPGGSIDVSAVIQAAVNEVAANGGIVRIPAGTWRVNNTVVISGTRVSVVGDDAAGCRIEYYGTGAVFDMSGDGYLELAKMRIVNTGGTGTHGVVVGKSGSVTGWKYEVRNVEVDGFLTAGLHVANCEQSIFHKVYAHSGNAVGFLVDNSRHSTNSNGINNRFEMCRAHDNVGRGWDINEQSLATFDDCQSLNNNAGNTSEYQFRLGGSSVACRLYNLDLEDHAATGTNGITVSGSGHLLDGILGFQLTKLIDLNTTSNIYIGRVVPSTITTVLTIGATCTHTTYLDAGNLGTVSNGAPTSTYAIGFAGATRRLTVNGEAGGGYILFRSEQSVDPAAPSANGAILFTKDNGSGKTQLCVRFASGLTQVFATEP